MKTILYNPIFINPQAYYVFPRLTRYLQPDNESTAEPANYIGTIEVKVIAYGDTTLKRTYTNTDSIDLSEFKNTWIRISLFTKVGSCVLGEWKIGNMESDLPYIDPEVLASLKAVVIVGNKTNNDSDRAIVKNLVDADNPFVISNAAFKLNSGFGKYEQDFTDWKKSLKVTSFDSESIKFTSDVTWALLYHPSSIGEDIPSFKVRIKLYGEGTLYYNYITQEGKYTSVAVKSEIFETPICYNTKYIGEKGVNVGFTLGVTSGECSGTITQIPSFEGAFVTDGIDDLITSTKTVQEMGITDKVTVVSMIHQIDLNSTYTIATTNYIENSNSREHVRSDVYNYGKTGIYGYSASLINNTKSDIKNILGDEADYYVKSTNSLQTIFDAKFSVVGRISELTEASQVAWYWTIIANKVLTTDQINQVIAYFNLDRTLKPDILCDVKKQGITNDNHAEFGDKLIDFSGNGRDIQLNNLAWDGDSGIGKYNYPNWKVTATIANTYSTIVNYPTVNGTYSINVNGVSELMQSIGLHLEIKYTTSTGIIYNDIKQDGVYSYILPDGATDLTLRFGGIPGIVNEPCNITITQIPSHAGALCLDGVSDFGKVTGMPVYKDYTVVADYERFYLEPITGGRASILSKSSKVGDGSFIFNLEDQDGGKACYTFGEANGNVSDDITRIIRYQSKYYNTKTLSIGTAEDNDFMVLGKVREVDSRHFCGAIYSLMSFPYSMSEFLIERQLKKYKLGTLYPNMVEFRPVIKSNASYDNIVFYYKNEKVENGTYLTVGSSIGMHIRLSSSPVNEIKSITVNGIPATFKYHDANNNIYQYDFNLTSKSPQNINITIDEYIRFEDIVQPYPVLLRFKDENGNEVSWGGKFRVGSTITRIGSAADSNLLPNIYNIFGLLLNDNQVTSSKVIVEKTMVFKAKSAYIFDNNEPNCILSPRLLRIPNSSYKILGHIPDISGHGNNGVIHNSTYAQMSGANGYGTNLGNWSINSANTGKIITQREEHLEYEVLSADKNILFYNTKIENDTFVIYTSVNTNIVYSKESDIIANIPANTPTKVVCPKIGTILLKTNETPTVGNIITVKQYGIYEGAYCFDGVDDFVTIPTVTGGKQVLMKVNWDDVIANAIIYDQRDYPDEFAIYNADKDNSNNPVFAYQARNTGQTYIDGILNSNIKASELKAITHNITITNELSAGVNKSSPVIGSNIVHNDFFVNMALYDFMLFDEISTDDKILELNEYVGIESNTE